MGGRRVKEKLTVLLVLVIILFLMFLGTVGMIHQILQADQEILNFINETKRGVCIGLLRLYTSNNTIRHGRFRDCKTASKTLHEL